MSKTYICLLTLSLLSCSKLTTISVTQSATSTVPGANLLQQLAGSIAFSGLTDMDISQNESLANQGVKKNQIDSCKLTACTLSVTSPSGQTLDFLSSLAFSASTSGEPTVEVAHGTSFANATASLDVDDVELKPYVTADSMDITTHANGQSPAQDTNITATLTFAVQVDLVGVVTGK